MSSQRNSSQRYGSGTLSGSLGRGASGPSGQGSYSKGYGSGLVSLGTTKKPRTASSLPERKLSVPRPVNLPSLRKENAGNDPNTQLVPSGGGGGWQRPEQKEETSQEPAPNLTAGSSWASAPSSSGVPSWQPPQPFPVATAAAPRGRSLNPHEYPSLSAAATSKQPSAAKQPLPHLPTAGSQGGGNWDEDERKPSAAPAVRSTGESWADSRFEDDERPAYRPPWETNGRPEWRGPSASEGSYSRPYGGGEDYWNARGQAAGRGGYSPKPAAPGFDRFREAEDQTLFPPPPPPRHQPPPPPPPRPSEASREEAEAEKRAFEEEIDRVIEEERRRKREIMEAARPPPVDSELQEEMPGFDKVLVRPPPPPPPPPQLTAEEQAAAAEAARQKVLALRKQREAKAEEAERIRREAAAAKLKELEERIARKAALQRELKEKELQAAGIPAPEDSAGSALTQVEEAAAAAVDASAESAVQSAQKALHPEEALARSASKDSLLGKKPTSSVEAEASSSVGQPDGGFADLDAMAGGSVHGAGEGVPPTNEAAAWNKRPSQPKALWQRKDRDLAAKGSLVGSPLHHTEGEGADSAQLPPADDTGASALFGSSSGFGPALVATSLGINPEGLPGSKGLSGRQAAAEAPPGVQPPPPIVAGPLSWRAVLGGNEVEQSAADVRKPEEPRSARALDSPGRGRGRGRRDREYVGKDERQGPGGRGERGRGRSERGRGRGRGRQDVNDDASVASAGASSIPESGSSTPHEGRRLSQRQRGEGRGRGNRVDVQLDARGRGRGQRPVASSASLPVSEARVSSMESPPSLPPGIPRAAEVVLPPVEAGRSAPTLAVPEASSAGCGSKGLQSDMPQISQLNLNKPASTLSPALDPVAPLGPDARTDRAIDRPIERPKSAAGVVGRPKSAPQDLLPNGMPVLPNDLSLDGPPNSARATQNPASITFGFNPPQNPAGLSPGPFPGVFFPAQQTSSNNPWQPAGSGPQSQPNLEAAVESFYKAGGPNFGSTFSQAPPSQPPSSGLQFGAFGAHSFPQFGQLGTSFGQAPFIHTGKQPDWSTGPVSSMPSSSGLRSAEQVAASSGGGSFSRAQGMDAIVPSPNIQKRGPQGAPGPPGLQRHAPGPPILQGGPGMPHNVRPPVQAPPGLQHHPAPGGPQFGGLQRGGGSVKGDQRLLPGLGFPGEHQGPAHRPPMQQLQGPPPGIGAPLHSALPSAREQAASLPDNVFETSEMKLTDATPGQPHPQIQPAANGQARRNNDGRGKGGRAVGGRGQGRGRNFGRSQGGRGMPSANLGGPPPFHQGGPPGTMPSHNFLGPSENAFTGGALSPADSAAHSGEPGHGTGGPKREGRGGGRGKARGRSDRGRGRDAKFVYAAQIGQSSTGPAPQPSG